MRQFLLLLVLVLVPFQYAWAGVSAYCQHEEGKAAQHFGHHVDFHHGDANAAHSDHAGSKSKSFESDHHHCVSPAMVTVAPALEPLLTLFVVHLSPPLGFSSSIVGPPERPNWSLAA